MNLPVTATSNKKRQQKAPGHCLSCGAALSRRRRRYCSNDCRGRLRRKLDQRTGLLRALNARYATFYFTDRVVVMDVLPHGARKIFSFLFPRSSAGSPADDYSAMANILGNVWWEERRRTNRRYLASQRVLEVAGKRGVAVDEVRPLELRSPSVKKSLLIHLKIGPTDLDHPDRREVIKRAYRRQVMANHPDRGGTADAFRKVHRAYEDLMAWAERPSFTHQRGFPDKWFYDGHRNAWVQPTPPPRS